MTGPGVGGEPSVRGPGVGGASSVRGPGVGGVVHALRSLLSPPAFATVPPAEDGVPFGPRGRGIPRVADVHRPAEPDGSSVVLVHGGGWALGSRRMKPMRYLAGLLAGAGATVVVGDYRLLLRGGGLREAAQDVGALLDWWGGRVAADGLDPARIAGVGLSAGATTLLLAAEGRRLARIVPVFGVYDFAAMRGGLGSLWAPLVLRGQGEALSPLRRAPPGAPVTLMHGTADALVPVAQARAAAAAWRAAGVSVDLLEYEGLPHAFFNDAQSEGCQRASADLLAALGLRRG